MAMGSHPYKALSVKWEGKEGKDISPRSSLEEFRNWPEIGSGRKGSD